MYSSLFAFRFYYKIIGLFFLNLAGHGLAYPSLADGYGLGLKCSGRAEILVCRLDDFLWAWILTVNYGSG